MSKRRSSRKGRKKKASGYFLLGLGFREKLRRRDGESVIRYKFFWKKIFALLGVLILVGWIGCGTALYFYFKSYRGYEEASWVKMMVLPLRKAAHMREMGEFFIEKGSEEIRAGEFRSGIHKLRSGLKRAPANAEARLLLSRLYLQGLKDRVAAAKVLTDGLRYSDKDEKFLEREYLRFVMYLLAEDRRTAEIVELVDEIEPQIKDPAIANFLIFEKAAALIGEGKFYEGYDLLRERGIQSSPSGILLISQILWCSGQEQLSILALQRGMTDYPDFNPMAASLYAKLSDLDRWEELKRLSSLQIRMGGGDLGSWKAHLVSLQETGDFDQIMPTVERILIRFPNRKAYTEMLAFAAEHGYPNVAEVVLLNNKAPQSEIFNRVYSALSHLRSGSPDRAIQLLGRVNPDDESDEETDFRLSAVRSLALFQLGEVDAAETDLKSFFQSSESKEADFLVMGEAFIDAGLVTEGVSILRAGVDRLPESEVLRGKLFESGEGAISNTERTRIFRELMELKPLRLSTIVDAKEMMASDDYLFVDGRSELFDSIDERISQIKELERYFGIRRIDDPVVGTAFDPLTN